MFKTAYGTLCHCSPIDVLRAQIHDANEKDVIFNPVTRIEENGLPLFAHNLHTPANYWLFEIRGGESAGHEQDNIIWNDGESSGPV